MLFAFLQFPTFPYEEIQWQVYLLMHTQSEKPVTDQPKLAQQYYKSHVRPHHHSAPPNVAEYRKILFKYWAERSAHIHVKFLIPYILYPVN
jgi:hypothetical protein